jgi:DNA-binding LacI/PurR family transcriptional regulator
MPNTVDQYAICAKAPCSLSTVQRVYRGVKVSDLSRVRVERAAAELGLSPPPPPVEAEGSR